MIASVVVPNKALKGFKKVMIKAGETVTVKVPIRLEDLMVWTVDQKFVLEPGTSTIYTGGGYADLSLKTTLTVV